MHFAHIFSLRREICVRNLFSCLFSENQVMLLFINTVYDFSYHSNLAFLLLYKLLLPLLLFTLLLLLPSPYMI